MLFDLDIKRTCNLVQEMRLKLATETGVKKQIEKDILGETDILESRQSEKDIMYKSSRFLLEEIVERRENAIKGIESLCNISLARIHGDSYSMYFESNDSARQEEGADNFKMEIKIKSQLCDDSVSTGLYGSRSGGLIEVISFILRITALDWMNYKGPLIIDEAWKSMSKDDKIHEVAVFLRQITDNSMRQVIFVTHDLPVFKNYADNIVTLSLKNGVSTKADHNKDEDEDW